MKYHSTIGHSCEQYHGQTLQPCTYLLGFVTNALVHRSQRFNQSSSNPASSCLLLSLNCCIDRGETASSVARQRNRKKKCTSLRSWRLSGQQIADHHAAARTPGKQEGGSNTGQGREIGEVGGDTLPSLPTGTSQASHQLAHWQQQKGLYSCTGRREGDSSKMPLRRNAILFVVR